MCKFYAIKCKFCYLISTFWEDFLRSEAFSNRQSSHIPGWAFYISAKCVSTSFIFWFQFGSSFKISLGSFVLHGSSVYVCSLYLENLLFHLVSKAENKAANVIRGGVDQNELGCRKWFGTAFQDLYFYFFFILLHSGKIESPSERGRISGSQVFKMQVSTALDGVSSAWQEQNLVQKASKSPQLRYYPFHLSCLPKCPGLSLLSSFKHLLAFSLFLLPPSSLNCQCPWIWTSSQTK